MKPIIHTIIKGRNGNQLFQYAFSRVMQELTGGQLVLDFSELGFNKREGKYGPQNHMVNALDYFNVSDYTYVDAGTEYTGGAYYRFQLFVYKLFRRVYIAFPKRTELIAKLSSGLLQRLGIYYQFGTNSFLNYRKPSKNLKNIFVRGWFESANYFDSIKKDIIKELSLSATISSSLSELQNKLRESDSICISIRRGDFTSNSFKDEFLVCDNDYYANGISYIIDHLSSDSSIIVLVCSDDIEWCKNNIKLPTDRVIYEPQGLSFSDTLHLMTSCHHFVMSNSTFSFWAQYLSDYPNKMVIAPSIWRRCTPPVKDIYMKEWILLECK